jgi:hypothetical protein
MRGGEGKQGREAKEEVVTYGTYVSQLATGYWVEWY